MFRILRILPLLLAGFRWYRSRKSAPGTVPRR
jgi:hypothetical protein